MPAHRREPLLLGEHRPPLGLGIAAAAAGVASTTVLLYGLREVAPVVSLGVVYVLVVLAVSIYWGLVLGIATSLASALAFNFFHIPPTGRLTIADSQNWVGLFVFLAVAVVASAIAEVARERAADAQQRRAEADLGAAAAHALLGGTRLADGLVLTGHRLASALGLPSAELVLWAAEPAPGFSVYPLRAGDRVLGTLVLPGTLPEDVDQRLRERIAPALEALLAAAIEREALQAEVVETAALRRSDDLKTAILRAVSHDLRSPLTAIVSSGEALGSASLDAEDRAALAEAIAAEGARLEGLIEKLLDLSRLQAGEAPPRLEWVDVADVLTSAREHVAQPELVRLQPDRALPPIRADAVQLERALSNLMENAIGHGGGQPVSVRAHAIGSRLVIRVVDRGPGIPAVEQERIFEAFYRGGTAGRRPTGSGLGLAIVRGFVEANGGSVRLESLPGQGASFVVEFPVDDNGRQPSA